MTLRHPDPRTVSETLDLIELTCQRSTRWHVPDGDPRSEDERLVARVRRDVLRDVAPILSLYGRDVITAVIEALSGPPAWGRTDTIEIDLRRFVAQGLGRQARPKVLRDALTALRELSRWTLSIRYRSPRHHDQRGDREIALVGQPLVEIVEEHHGRHPGRIALGERIPTSVTVRMPYYMSTPRWYVLVPRSALTASLMENQLTEQQVAAARARTERRGTRLARIDLLDDYLRSRLRHSRRPEVWVTDLDLARACGVPGSQPRKRRWAVRRLVQEAVRAGLVEVLDERQKSRRVEGESVVEYLLRPVDRAVSGRDIREQALARQKTRKRNHSKNNGKRTNSTMLGTLFDNVGNAIRQCWERPIPKSTYALGALRDSADTRSIRRKTEYTGASPERRAPVYSSGIRISPATAAAGVAS